MAKRVRFYEIAHSIRMYLLGSLICTICDRDLPTADRPSSLPLYAMVHAQVWQAACTYSLSTRGRDPDFGRADGQGRQDARLMPHTQTWHGWVGGAFFTVHDAWANENATICPNGGLARLGNLESIFVRQRLALFFLSSYAH